MQKLNITITTQKIMTFIVLASLLVAVIPFKVFAATSGGARIYNAATVQYTSGPSAVSGWHQSTASVTLIVNTVAAVPEIYLPAGLTKIAGSSVSYNISLKSNANGYDNYLISNLTTTANNVAAATNPSITSNLQLWGGIALGSQDGSITVPYGTATQLVQSGMHYIVTPLGKCLVTSVSDGQPAHTDIYGNTSPEQPDTIYLGSGAEGDCPTIIAGSIPAGTQVGEVRSFSMSFTTGNPTNPGVDGTYSTTFNVSSSTPPAFSITTGPIITTVSSPKVTITKTANPATGVAPGGVVTYTITMTNTHKTAITTGVTLVDNVPAYTNYIANSMRLNNIPVANDGVTSPLVSGILVDANNSRTSGTIASGILPAGGVATVQYQVQVQ